MIVIVPNGRKFHIFNSLCLLFVFSVSKAHSYEIFFTTICFLKQIS